MLLFFLSFYLFFNKTINFLLVFDFERYMSHYYIIHMSDELVVKNIKLSISLRKKVQ